MNPTLVLGLAGGAVILVTMFEMLRRHRLREKYAVLWAVIALGAVLVALVPGILTGLADLVGVEVPANLLFFVASMLLMLITVQHSYELGRLEDKTRTLAEELALLRIEMQERTAGGPDPAPGGPGGAAGRGWRAGVARPLRDTA